MAGDPAPDREREIIRGLVEKFAEGQARRLLPAAAPTQTPLRPIAPLVQIFPLGDASENWRDLDDRFALSSEQNKLPWYRCLGILRSLGAQTAILEKHYVCLDFRSEFASFYAHLDAPRRSATVRLHFFGMSLQLSDVINLAAAEGAESSYLGYIVCREGDLPLVGRAVLRAPAYVRADPGLAGDLAVVDEPVNFLGQKLIVRGVPFMQQDERFAVCAHVATWVTHYSAFRRGLVQRRLIADFVSQSGSPLRLRPGTAAGLTRANVESLYEAVGLRALRLSPPTVSSEDAPVFGLSIVEGGEAIFDELLAGVGEQLDGVDDAYRDVCQFLTLNHRIVVKLEIALDERDEGSDAYEETRRGIAAYYRLADLVVLHVLRPFLRSGFPVYAGTQNHAVVICGWKRTRDGRVLSILHDDAVGPYLVSEDLACMSLHALQEQVAERSTDPLETFMPADNSKELAENPDWAEAPIDRDREIVHYSIPVPAGVLLMSIEAEVDASIRLVPLADELLSSIRVTREPRSLRSSVLMGIDYKDLRRRDALGFGDASGASVFSSVHLAEWVVVVEVLVTTTDGTQSVADFVYDASSGRYSPRLQLVRVGSSTFSIDPLASQTDQDVLHSRIHVGAYQAVQPPIRVGKVSTALDLPHPTALGD